MGVAIRKKLAPGVGPIERIQLRSGRRIGGSSLSGPNSPNAYTAEVVAAGPVLGEVVCRAAFSEEREWKLRFTVQANESVVLVEESFSLGDDSAFVQWIHGQQGAPTTPGIGGFYPMLAGYRTFLLDPSIPEKAPQWTSELFPEAGVMLRSGCPTDRETQLYLIAGRNHAHYDDDSGSFTLWTLISTSSSRSQARWT